MERREGVPADSLCKIRTIEELKELLTSVEKIKLYGAGYYLTLFLQEIELIDSSLREKIECIMVSDISGNVKKIGNIPVVLYEETNIHSEEYILLTLGHRYTEEVYEKLKKTGANIFQINYHIFQEGPYQEVKKSIQPFIDKFPAQCFDINLPISDIKIKAWTCWWQGEAQAPEIVKVCWKSQKKYLPADVEHIIITEKNYRKYIVLPEHILEKVRQGKISIAALSDMIRASLLYKYGGFWMDATLLLIKPLDRNVLEYPIYTRNLPETQFCSNAMWAGWFLYVKPGNILFQFLAEAFFYYFLKNDKLLYYLTVDYFIAIACNQFPEVETQLRNIPYNNERALELGKHLREIYNKEKFEFYTKDSYIQKLSYKVGQDECKENTIYTYLLKT